MTQDQDPGSEAELDALKELRQLSGYRLVVARILEEIESRRNELEKGGDPIYTRGVIAGLRLVLEVPGYLISEIETDLTKEAEHGT